MSTQAADVFLQPSKNSASATWMAGFFPLGVLLGMLGSLIIAWRYHTDSEPHSIGLHFLAMSAGFVFASQILNRLRAPLSLRAVAVCSTGLAFLSLVALGVLAPPAAPVWRIGALSFCGLAAGALTHSLFYANQTVFEAAPANRAGALFVGGALLATSVSGLTYFTGSQTTQPALLAVVPAVYLAVLIRDRCPLARPNGDAMVRATLKDLHSIAALLFSLLILFQFVCEWAIASWLPLFLIHTLGINPVTAIWALGLYLLALMSGRLLAQFLLPIVSHKKMLLFSAALAMTGYLFLSMTSLASVALIAAAVLGLGHAPVYPLVAKGLHDRLTYHPGFYGASISIAIAAATATPWLLGYVAESFGMPSVMLIPSIASIAVLILTVLIMLEARLMGRSPDDSRHGLMASDT